MVSVAAFGEAFAVELLLLLLLLRLALEALLLHCSSIGFGSVFAGFVVVWLCSWLVEATLWDFFSRVWYFCCWGQSGFSRASSGLKEISAMMPLSIEHWLTSVVER